jgi:hypothetical protein
MRPIQKLPMELPAAKLAQEENRKGTRSWNHKSKVVKKQGTQVCYINTCFTELPVR